MAMTATVTQVRSRCLLAGWVVGLGVGREAVNPASGEVVDVSERRAARSLVERWWLVVVGRVVVDAAELVSP
jgi:hypothetical protein